MQTLTITDNPNTRCWWRWTESFSGLRACHG
jgi:hypothetical protein